MKSLLLDGPQSIRLVETATPTLATPTSAMVRITHASICGSDLGPYAAGPWGDSYPIGHEAVGVVEAVGAQVESVRPGDRVVISGTAGCGTCAMCEQNEAMLCASSPYPPVYGHGFPGLGGCQSEVLAVPAADFNLFPLLTEVPDEVGVLLADTLATASAAVARSAVRADGTVAVIGLGAVGLQAILVAKARGAGRVLGFDPLPERRAYAATLGAETFDPTEPESFSAGTVGADSVIDAHGSQHTLLLALQVLNKGGSVAVVGIPKESGIDFPAQLAMGKSASVHYVACSIQTQIPALLDELRTGALPVRPLVSLFTHRFPLERGTEAYELFASRSEGVIKVLLTTSTALKGEG